jgi:hypothetical protein
MWVVLRFSVQDLHNKSFCFFIVVASSNAAKFFGLL